MADLTKEQVLKIAELACLRLTDEEVKSYQEKLGRVLSYMKELEVLSLKEGLVNHVPSDALLFSKDSVEKQESTWLLNNAPTTSENAFVIPGILKDS